MYRKILVELKQDRSDRDILPLLQELIDSGDVREVLLVRRIERSPVVAIDYPLKSEDFLAVDQSNESRAARYLRAVEKGFRWRKVEHRGRVIFAARGESMAELAKREGCDIAFLPARQESGFLRWFWRRATGHVERAGTLPLAIYGRPVRHRVKAA